jgi:hypothetical protein
MSIAVTPGSGATVAADQIGSASAPASGQLVQYLKLDLGAAGSSNPIVAGQQTMANSVPVVLASNQTAVSTSVSDPVATTGTISAADSGTSSATNAIGQTTITGSPTASSFVAASLSGCSTARIQLKSNSTFTGTIVFEKSFDGGTTYLSTMIAAPGTTGPSPVSSATFAAAVSTQEFLANCGGVTNIRVRATSVSGSAPTVSVTIQPAYGVTDIGIPGTVNTAPVQGTLTDRSGTITTGGTAQVLAASNTTRKYLFIQNNSIAPLWYNFTTTAAQSQPSVQLAAGASMYFGGPYITTEAVSIIGATTGQAFTAKEG